MDPRVNNQVQGGTPPTRHRAGWVFKACLQGTSPGPLCQQHSASRPSSACPVSVFVLLDHEPLGDGDCVSGISASSQHTAGVDRTENWRRTTYKLPPLLPASLLLFFWVFRAPSSHVLMCSLQIEGIWKTLTSKRGLGTSQKIHGFRA